MWKQLIFIASLLVISKISCAENLTELYRSALEKDPTWLSAKSLHLAIKEKLHQGQANFYPSLVLNAGTSATHFNIQYLGSNAIFRNAGSDSYQSYQYQLLLNQPIFRKTLFAQLEQAKTQTLQADSRILAEQQNLILRVSTAYFDALLANEKETLLAQQKKAVQRQLEEATARFDSGLATIVDVNEAKARLDLTTALEFSAKSETQFRRNYLISIVGFSPQSLTSLKEVFNLETLTPEDVQAWLTLSNQNSLTLNIQKNTVDIAEQEINRQKAGHYPSLDLIASYTNSYANKGINGFGSDLSNATIGLQLQLPLYQGGMVGSKIREAVALHQQTQYDLSTQQKRLEVEVQQSYWDNINGIYQVSAYQEALRSAQSQFDATKLGFELGLRTQIDVLNAQQMLFSAKKDLTISCYDYLQKRLKLKALAGTLTEDDLKWVDERFNS